MARPKAAAAVTHGLPLSRTAAEARSAMKYAIEMRVSSIEPSHAAAKTTTAVTRAEIKASDPRL
jgi:hypothetical protein